jgi:TonB-linked SusC/RagA family outer membrane protein
MKFIFTNGMTGWLMRSLILGALLCMCAPGLITAAVTLPMQGHRVTGIVTSADEQRGLPGVSIVVKGTTTGTVTDQDGQYRIDVAPNDILVFSFVGYESQEVGINGRTAIDIVLQPSVEALQEVVVTALGIEREEKSLGYSVGRVDGDELTRVAQENFLGGIAGKVPGVVVNSTGGPGSTVSVIIRGATSLTTDNQPLFVVDGVPMNNTVNNVGGFGSRNPVDYGNAIGDLDPESIESVTVLKGPSAAALYGTRAGNGVILITTKKAKAGQGMRVSVSSNTVFDLPAKHLNVQNKFGQGAISYRPENVGSNILPSSQYASGGGPELDRGYWQVQWHSPRDANGQPIPIELVSYPDNMKNFLNDFALTSTNSIALSNGGQAINYRIGVTNTTHSGLIPNSDLKRNNVSFAAASKVHEKLTVSTDINYVNSWADNRPASDRGTNPLESALRVPANIDIRDLRDYSADNDYNRITTEYENPWVMANEVNNSFNRYQIFGNVMATWEITPKLSLMGRVAINKSDQTQETKIGLGYWRENNNGTYGISTNDHLEQNMDVLASYENDWEDFSMRLSAGGNALYSKNLSMTNAAKSGVGLILPNLFNLSNIKSTSLDYSSYRSERAINSLYATANFGWRDIVYLDLTARNDWSSTLPAANRSYFYPSASLSVVLNEVIDMGNKVDMIKLRGGWAKVGNDTGPYRLIPTYQNLGPWGTATQLAKQAGLLSPNLLPEEATSFEVGTDVKLFGDRVRFEGTYYRSNNRNQILEVPLAVSSGFTSIQINAGLLQSRGFELALGVTPIRTTDWTLDLSANFTKDDTRILELAENVPFKEFWNQAKVRNIGYVKDEANGHDGRVGNLYAQRALRVNDPTSPYHGFPILMEGEDAEWAVEEEWSKVGNYNPDFIVGMQTSVTYKNFSLNATFDWRKGGQYVSQTFRYFSEWGISGAWMERLINPGELGGETSDALREWVLAHADEVLFGAVPRPIGGPTPEYGGFPEEFGGAVVYDGTLTPGVYGYYDDNGKFILERESLGGTGSAFQPYSISYPWEQGEANMFDADYIKLREISLSYRLPQSLTSRLKMQDINLAIYSRNIMLWAKDAGLGMDPERAYQPGGNTFLQGVERFNGLPWVIPVGFKLNLTF